MRTVTTPEGLTLMARRDSDFHIAWGGHEAHLVALCGALLEPGDTFLDVGAHVGTFALRVAEKAEHVVALEPAPDTLEGLLLNIALNYERCRNVTAVGVAAWSSATRLSIDGVARLTSTSNRPRTYADGSTHLTEEPSPNMVDAVPLDDLMDDVLASDHVGLIKVDVEGNELHVLLGAEKLVARDRPKLCLEIHDELTGEDSWSLISRWLSEHQYVTSAPIPAGIGFHIIATPEETADDSDGRDEGSAALAG